MLRADSGSPADRYRSKAAQSAALRFYRTSRAYPDQGTGHPNSYQLFLERALRLTRPGGRIGLLLPSGIATDRGSTALRRHLFERTSIDSWIVFDKRRRIFPIHRSVRFVLMSTTNGGSTTALRCRSGVTDPAELHSGGEQATLTIARSRLESWNPEHLTIPDIPDTAALSVLTDITDRVPPLSAPGGWNARFGRELNATDDRPQFAALSDRHTGLLPIVEGKQLAPFQVDVRRSRSGIPATAAAAIVEPAQSFARHRVGYRDVASATNRLTLIAAMLPAGVISTHTVFCLKTAMTDEDQWCLLGLLNSLVANFLVRLQVTTHVTTTMMSRLPVPKPPTAIADELAALSRRLAETGISEAPTE